MRLDRQVALRPPKPLMIFDGDCQFCARWVCRWQKATAERVDYLPYQDARLAEQFPELSHKHLKESVHLVEPDGTVFFGAEAALRALAANPDKRRWLAWYQRFPVFAGLAEWAYRFVAKYRGLLSRIT
jgi:lipase maturation factor 1